MARARTKKELLDFGEKEYQKLIDLVETFSDKEFTQTYVFDNRTIKDVIAHLVAWQKLFLMWYEKGMNEEKPEIPAPGYTFKTTPELNEKLYKEYKSLEPIEILTSFSKNHKKLINLITSHTSTELEEKKKYAWTGSTNLASYLASTTSSHYQWASALLKKTSHNK